MAGQQPKKFRVSVPPWFSYLPALLVAGLTAGAGTLPAFPGAEGFGSLTPGGRGGREIAVTNLNPSGPGSFREACLARGPRTVVFHVAGTISLDTLLVIREPYLTIAGQTAPGDGICIRNYGLVLEETHDIVVRYLRVRPGDPARAEQDAIWVHSSHDVVIDHCSTSWGTDETLSVTGGGSTNVTVQWCIIAESLNNSVHHKGPHGYGSLLRTDGNLSFHHNLYAHHSSRNPRPGCDGDQERGGMLDFRNNLVYDWGERPGYSMTDKTALNLIANYYRPGPSTASAVSGLAFMVGGKSTNLYAAGNVHEGNPAADADNWRMIAVENPAWTSGARLPVPLQSADVTTQTAAEARDRILDSAGATLPVRDRVDIRIVEDVRKGTGHIIDTQTQVGGWPEYASAADPRDGATAAATGWAVRIGDSFCNRHPGAVTYDSLSPSRKWNYEQGLMLTALWRLGEATGDPKYREFVRRNLDAYVRDDGSIDTYARTDYNLDNIAPGRVLLALSTATGAKKFRFAADTLHRQLREQPRTSEGGYWHKKIYPYQMWLDGLYMAQPFAAAYAVASGDSAAYDDVVNQFVFMAHHARDSATGLFYHGWDERRDQRWANPNTGTSPSFWGRAMGWYMMALVDVLDILPEQYLRRAELIPLIRDLAKALLPYRDPATHLWYQVVDQGNRKGNYLESSASAMFAYAYARGAARGYLDASYRAEAESTFSGLLRTMVAVHEDGTIDLKGTCRSAGLGGTPYRDGSFAYYCSEPQRLNDMKGLGPLLLAAIELERNHTP